MGLLDVEHAPLPPGPLVVDVHDGGPGPGPWVVGTAVLGLLGWRALTGHDVVAGWFPEAAAVLLAAGGAALWAWWRARPRPRVVFDPAARTVTFLDGAHETRLAFDDVVAVEVPRQRVDPSDHLHQGSHAWGEAEPYEEFGRAIWLRLRDGGSRLVRESGDPAERARTRERVERVLGLGG